MYVCMLVHVHLCVCVCTRTCVCACVQGSASVCMYLCTMYVYCVFSVWENNTSDAAMHSAYTIDHAHILVGWSLLL